jgi:hypothetical protein
MVDGAIAAGGVAVTQDDRQEFSPHSRPARL